MALSSCQTGKPKEPEPGEPIRAGHLIPLVPVSVNAQIHFAEGSYPELYSGESTAVWAVGQAPKMLPGQAAQATRAQEIAAAPGQAPPSSTPLTEERFVVFEVRLKSSFSDASIAYDAVGMKGINVYLLPPTGEKIPAGKIDMGRDLEESQQGALKVFARTSRLMFPRDQVKLVVPYGFNAPSLRLVLEGYGCTFYFEWVAELPMEIGPPPVRQSEEAERAREGLKKTREKAHSWSHTLD